MFFSLRPMLSHRRTIAPTSGRGCNRTTVRFSYGVYSARLKPHVGLRRPMACRRGAGGSRANTWRDGGSPGNPRPPCIHAIMETTPLPFAAGLVSDGRARRLPCPALGRAGVGPRDRAGGPAVAAETGGEGHSGDGTATHRRSPLPCLTSDGVMPSFSDPAGRHLKLTTSSARASQAYRRQPGPSYSEPRGPRFHRPSGLRAHGLLIPWFSGHIGSEFLEPESL